MKRRTFLLGAAAAVGATAIGAGGYWLGRRRRAPRNAGKMVIVIGIDGMDPVLSQGMMDEGLLPNLAKLRSAGGFSPLGTSCPPQSPVAWANFINGAGPGSHGIFDFIQRHPEHQCVPFYGGAETVPGHGGWEIGDHKVPLDFWPFDHKPDSTVLRRQGEPFWDFLDADGVPTTFYDLPSNYPPSPSHHGHHRCISGMGTPDLLGSYGTYQYFAEDVPAEGVEEPGGKRTRLSFSSETAKAKLVGPNNGMLKKPQPIEVEFSIHRDRQADACVIEIQSKRILLKAGQWSRWLKLEFTLTGPTRLMNETVGGICRFFLQAVGDNVRLYVTPINVDPSRPAVPLSEPPSFVTEVSKKRGLFYTTGFKEDYNARKNKTRTKDDARRELRPVFDDDEYARQAEMVLEERLALFEQAVDDYDGGLLFFYFSSSDLQSHLFWWDAAAGAHPTRTDDEAAKGHARIRTLYQRLDRVIGDVVDRYGARATIFVMSDHGFANFGRQFNLNSWLKDFGYLQPGGHGSIMSMTEEEWSVSVAYGLGMNGLYLNRKGRERHGSLEPGKVEDILEEIKKRLLEEAVDPDNNNAPVIRGVYRSDEIYQGNATALAPDLIIGYARGYRVSWESCQGELTPEVLSNNEQAWSADHCADALEVPGVLWCNKPFRAESPSLVDVAPSILAEFGRAVPATMSGRSIFS
jgi:predicted AlkP superfamily phosphohydrolase/phosphomutase